MMPQEDTRVFEAGREEGRLSRVPYSGGGPLGGASGSLVQWRAGPGLACTRAVGCNAATTTTARTGLPSRDAPPRTRRRLRPRPVATL